MYKILLTIWPAFQWIDKYCLGLALASTLVYSATPAIAGWIIVHLFQTFYQNSEWVQEARKWSLILAGVACCEAAAAFSIHFLFETLAQTWINSLRFRAFVKVLDQPKPWFDAESWSLSEIPTTIDRAAEEMRNLLGRLVPYVIIGLVMMSVSVIWCFVTCWKLTLVGVGCTPIVFLTSKALEVTSTFWESRTTDAANNIAEVFAESFVDVRTVRALTLESYFHKRYMTMTSRAFITGLKRSTSIGLCFGFSSSTIPFLTAGIFRYATTIARTHQCSMKDILVVLTLLMSTMASASAILAYIPQISSSVESGTRLLQLVNLPEDITQSDNAVNLDSEFVINNIAFCNVRFAYPTAPDMAILKGVDFEVRAGQIAVIVGASGSGKSTILSLVLGLYHLEDSMSGSCYIKISGHDINHVDMHSLRSHISYVPQQPVLFPMSIRDNILYGVDSNLSDTENRLRAAAESAGIHDFIMNLADGYDTVVGDGGLNVSGGQAQRIVVARALARQPKVLLMDEPTSALDPESAKIIRESIVAYKQGEGELKPLVIVVTHSPEMMRIADRIIVLETGKVAEDGTPAELLRSRGVLFQRIGTVSDV